MPAEPLLTGALALGALFVSLAVGIPVGVALGGIGLLGLGLTVGWKYALANAQTLPYGFASGFVWTTLPLFVLMGNLASESGVTTDLFLGVNHLLRRVRGGMYLAVVASSALFAAVSGSTVVNSVVFTRLALPEMLRLGYSRALSLGCICASGTFAAMIPPSLTMVLLALLTDQSVGRLFMAGVLPGIVSALVYAASILALLRFRPGLAPAAERAASGRPDGDEAQAAEARASFARSTPAIALFLLVLGGIYLGWFAPTAAGAVGACGALLLCLTRRGLPARTDGRAHGGWLGRALMDSVSIASSILLILVGGLFFSRFLVVAGTAGALAAAATEAVASVGPQALVLGLVAFYLVLGMVLDTASIMIVTLPIVFPIIQKAGVHPIWFSILFTKLIEVAVFSPPIGVNLFATLSAAGRDGDLRDLCRGVMPFLAMEVVNIAILIAFTALSTWLPERMFGP